jgi:DNA-binding IclR family transcriptional regulator
LSTGGSTDAVLAFVDRHIESIEQLEVLLLLAGSGRALSAAEIFQKIQSSQSSIEQRLGSLVTAGFVTRNEKGLYFFEPKEEAVRATVMDLADAYRTRRVRIIEAIYARKTDAVRTFADAFKFRKD